MMRLRLMLVVLIASWGSFASSRSTSASISLPIHHAGHSSNLHSSPLSSSLLLRLRGGGAKESLFPTLPPAFIHTVVISLFTNSIAILTCNEFLMSKSCGLPRWRVHVQNILITFVIYIAIFFFTGFVPMGYVPGAKPFVKFFEP